MIYKTIWASIGAGFGWLFGAAIQYLPILGVLIIIDTVFGMLAARKNGGITSKGFRRMTLKMIYYGGSIIAVNLAIATLGLATGALIVVVFALIACEVLSILEHWRASGYMPKTVEPILKKITGGIKKTYGDHE